MKKIIIALTLSIICLTSFKKANGDKIPSVIVKNLDGTKINTNTFSNNGKPIIVSFWATWCKPCKKELDAISKIYTQLQNETGVKLIAISVDDARSAGKVVTEVKTKAWVYEVYIDETKELQKAMNINNVPYTFLVDGDGKIVWSHDSYTDGDELVLIENVKKLSRGENISH